jgi:exodeoxyribonuclease V alpha subunit
VREAAADPASVFHEFCVSGLWSGVGPGLAGALTEAGIDGPDAVTEAALADLPGVTDKRARRLFSSWVGAAGLFEIATLLAPFGLPLRWARRLDEAGTTSADALRRDPWLLLTLPEAEVEQADALARGLDAHVRPDDPRRMRALVQRCLAVQARDGHTVSPPGVVAAGLSEHGLGAVDLAAAAIDAAVASGAVTAVPRPAGEAPWVALREWADAEAGIGRDLRRLAGAAKPLASEAAAATAASDLDAQQAGAVLLAAQVGVSVLTGGPGTGKSRTVTAVVRLCGAVGAEVAVAAPTGRAAKRLSELLSEPLGSARDDAGDAGGEAATTIHRLLGARKGPGEHGSVFERDAANPIEADMVVIDETSMLDAQLAAALLAAIPDGAHLLFVGDPAQLPSIGAGRVLGDILESGVFPTTELTTLYRQAAGGAIARLAAAVRTGELPAPDTDSREVVVVPTAGSGQAAHRVTQLVTDSIPRVFGLSADQIQVVTPIHRGPAGTLALNKALKEILNPGARGAGVRGFHVGDRVVATANHFDAEPTGFANGEIGTVVDAKGQALLVAFTGGQAEIAGKNIGDLQHGWAITVHRAQGSEWDAVVVVVPPEAGRMLSRPLIYTALTRARLHLSVVQAAGRALAHAVRAVGARPRRTQLTEVLTAGEV